MKYLNKKMITGVAITFIAFNSYADGPDFTDNLTVTTNAPSLKFNDSTTDEADWTLCVDNCPTGTTSESFSLVVQDGLNSSRPITVNNGTRTDALRFVGNNIGMGTATPAHELQIVSPSNIVFNFPPEPPTFVPGSATIRLESELLSSSKLWDINGGVSSFSISDASTGRIPFVISGANGNIGVGTSTPEAAIQVKRTSTASIPDLFELTNAGDVRFKFKDTVADGFWRMSVENSANQFVITRSGTGAPELKLNNTGDLSIRGGLTANVGTTDDTFPDYVFEKDYPLMSLSKLESFIAKNKHLPNIPSKADVKAKGGQLNMTDMQLKLLEKVEELTLYTLKQQNTIEQQHTVNSQLKGSMAKLSNTNEKLTERLASLEKLMTNLASNENTLPLEGETVAINEK